jgi:hypothetical protein
MLDILQKLAADQAGTAQAIGYMLSAVGTGFMISRLAIRVWMSRASQRTLEFSRNPASALIAMLFVPTVFLIYSASQMSWMGIDTPLLDAFLLFAFTCLSTAPITFVVVPLFGIYVCSLAHGATTNRSIHAAYFLCLVGHIFWLIVFVERIE